MLFLRDASKGGRADPPRLTHRVIDPGTADDKGGKVPTNRASRRDEGVYVVYYGGDTRYFSFEELHCFSFGILEMPMWDLCTSTGASQRPGQF